MRLLVIFLSLFIAGAASAADWNFYSSPRERVAGAWLPEDGPYGVSLVSLSCTTPGYNPAALGESAEQIRQTDPGMVYFAVQAAMFPDAERSFQQYGDGEWTLVFAVDGSVRRLAGLRYDELNAEFGVQIPASDPLIDLMMRGGGLVITMEGSQGAISDRLRGSARALASLRDFCDVRGRPAVGRAARDSAAPIGVAANYREADLLVWLESDTVPHEALLFAYYPGRAGPASLVEVQLYRDTAHGWSNVGPVRDAIGIDPRNVRFGPKVIGYTATLPYGHGAARFRINRRTMTAWQVD